jgi:hypothetical protein
MTTVRMPMRIRVELDGDRLVGDQPDTRQLELVREAAGRAMARAVERARAEAAIGGSAWSGQPPEVTIHFRGDPVPAWVTTHLEASTRSVVHAAVKTLQVPPSASAASSSASGANPGMTVTPISMTTQLRQFSTVDELGGAIFAHYDGTPPARVLVVARGLSGAPGSWLAEQGTDGLFSNIWWNGPMMEFRLPSGGAPAYLVPGFGHWVDELRYVQQAHSPAQHELVLRDVLLEGLRYSRGTTDKDLQSLAARRAKRFTWVGPRAFYQEFFRGSYVSWYRGPIGLTTTTLPVAMLTEEVPTESRKRPVYGSDCPPLTLSPVDETADPDKPFLHELAIEDWDEDDYATFTALVGEVARQLGIPAGQFVGSFVLAALAEIGRRCETLGEQYGTETRQAQLWLLSTALGSLDTLRLAHTRAMLARDRAKKLPCPLAGNSGQWATHFNRAYLPLRREVVGSLFVAACQDALLEVLEHSGFLIRSRIDGIADYMAKVRVLLIVMLADEVELAELKDRLVAASTLKLTTAGTWAAVLGTASLGNVTSAWGLAVDHFSEPLPQQVDTLPGRAAPGTVLFHAGAYRVRDQHGRWWTRQQIDATLDGLHQEVFTADPLLEKVADLPDVVERLRTAQRMDSDGLIGSQAVYDAIDHEFLELLKEIELQNLYRTGEVRKDRTMAFGLASFQEDASSEIGAKLTRIHQLADQRLRPMFSDLNVYLDGLRVLAGHEIGRAKLWDFLNLVGLPLLALFFPEVVLLVSGVQAIEGLQTAYEHRDLQYAMLGGDDIISRADVEAELWAAWIGAGLAFLPELPRASRAVTTEVRALLGREGSEAAAVALRTAMRGIAARLAEATVERLATAFVRDVAKGYVMNLAVSAAIGRITTAVAEEVRRGHGDLSVLDVPRIVGKEIADALTSDVPIGDVATGQETQP